MSAPRTYRGGSARSRSVVHVLGSVDRGGVEMRTLEAVQAMKESGIKIFMVTLTGREGSLAEEYRSVGASIIPMKLKNPFFMLRFMHFLKHERIDAVHSHVYLASGPILLLARMVMVRIRIAHFQTDGIGRAVGYFRRLRYLAMSKLLDWNATLIVGVSPFALDQWNVDWKGDRRCSVLVHGINLDQFSLPTQEDVRDELVLAPDEPIVAHVGRADIASKNREGALEIFARYCGRNDRGTLLFIGRDGADSIQAAINRESWTKFISDNGLSDRVRFLGERADVPALLKQADVLLFTSTLEGLPGVVVEARAAGVPVISTDLPGCRYIAESIHGVECLSIERPAAEWAERLEAALIVRPTWESREKDRERLRGTPFDVKSSAVRYQELWHS